ncbi:hypothetical protein T05_11417 [Trichinella murrelli]|uniref:Uncharacterized protein n=2 Tax=Trichinella TaxID=6333 RepID=A0A0V0TTL8_9BILA|nr:hypothetical protein T05_11417 [Trichinella murrelli]
MDSHRSKRSCATFRKRSRTPTEVSLDGSFGNLRNKPTSFTLLVESLLVYHLFLGDGCLSNFELIWVLLATKLYRLSAKNKVVSGDFIEDSTTGNNAKNTRALYEGQITKNKSTTRTSTIHAQSQAATVTMNAGTDAQESGSDQTNF